MSGIESQDQWFERQNDAAFWRFIYATVHPVIGGIDAACLRLADQAKNREHAAKISAGARDAWKLRRAKWGPSGRRGPRA